MNKQSRSEVAQIRQTTQYSCCAASIASALKAHGKNVTEDDVNRVLGAAPMAGASWEAMLATVQYFGLRGSLVVPSTPRMLKAWTDQGIPVVIAWNPEGRPWSHASTVFDVTEGPDGLMIHVMDPNIPNPSKTTRVLGEDEFCQKWSEKVSDNLIVRRPAMAIEREVSVDGKQVRLGSTPMRYRPQWRREEYGERRPSQSQSGRSQARIFDQWERDEDRAISRKKESPQAPKTIAESTAEEKIKILDALWVELDYEMADSLAVFVRQIQEDYRHHRKPSDEDLKKLRNIMYRFRMKPQADHFRVAGYHPSDRPEWIMAKPYRGKVNEAFIQRVRSHPHFRSLIGPGPSGGFTLVLPDFFDDPDYNGGSEYDVYFRPNSEPGWWDINMGMTNGRDILQVLSRELRMTPTRSASYSGNPGGKAVYPNEIDHGYNQPLAGGTDVMKRLQNQLLHEQGHDDLVRPGNPHIVAARWIQNSYRRTP